MQPDAPQTNLETWRALATRELKGAPLARLNQPGVDGLDLAPLYLEAPLRAPIPRARRGFLSVSLLDGPLAGRSSGSAPGSSGPSSGSAPVSSGDLVTAAAEERAGGAHGVALPLSGLTADDRARLADLGFDMILDTSNASESDGATTAPFLLGLDPTRWADRWADGAARDRDLASLRARSDAGTLVIPMARWHEAGADAPTELALGLAALVGTVRALGAHGFSVADVVDRLAVRVAIGSRYLGQLAKLRAWRRLASGVLAHAGLAPTHQPLVWAETARRALTRRDPWVNLLRGTASAFAAVTGGADLVSVQPFDAALGASDAFARRLARNTLHLLRDESALAHAHDPAAGAFALEQWTADLEARAWAVFQRLEAAGTGAVGPDGARSVGAPHSLGLLAPDAVAIAVKAIEAASAARASRLARRQDVLVGVSQYVDHDLTRLVRAPAEVPLDARLGGPRDAAPWEAFDALTGPRVAILTAGPLAEHQARSGWIADLLRARGPASAHDATATFHLGDAPDDASIAAAIVATATFAPQKVIVAAADARHADLLPPLGPALLAAVPCELIVAGRAEADPDPLRAFGVTRRVHAGLDLVAWLADALAPSSGLAAPGSAGPSSGLSAPGSAAPTAPRTEATP